MLQAFHAVPDPASPHNLAGLAERARALGRTEQADRFLLLAWMAFDKIDLPTRQCASQVAGASQQSGQPQA
jgi:hypothetical protein